MKKLSLKHEDTLAVDLDGTLAEYTDWKGVEHIGKPIQKMLDRVKKWIKEGKTVVIFTARAEEAEAIKYIEQWLEDNGIGGLEVTNQKSKSFIEIWDDRAIQVKPNTGERIDEND